MLKSVRVWLSSRSLLCLLQGWCGGVAELNWHTWFLSVTFSSPSKPGLSHTKLPDHSVALLEPCGSDFSDQIRIEGFFFQRKLVTLSLQSIKEPFLNSVCPVQLNLNRNWTCRNLQRWRILERIQGIKSLVHLAISGLFLIKLHSNSEIY